MDSDPRWQAILAYVKSKVNIQSYKSWLAPTRGQVQDGKILLNVPHIEFQNWIEEHFQRLIEEAIAANGYGPLAIEYILDQKKVVPEKPSTDIPRRAVYKEIPESAWYGLAKTYRAALAGTSNASDNFHLADFLAVMGSLLGKSVAYGEDPDRPIHPNLFMLTIGDSGTGKEQAAQKALTLMRQCDPNILETSHLTSAETLIDEMAEAKKRLGEGFQGPFATVLYLSELRELITKAQQKGAATLVNKLCTVFDLPRMWSAKARGQPTAWVANPFLVLIACTNPDWMKKADKSDLEGGLGSRVCMVPGEPKHIGRRWKAPNAALWSEVVQKIKLIRTKYPWDQVRFFKASEAAETLMDNWFEKREKLPHKDSMMLFLDVRDIVHLYKVALINAACDPAQKKFVIEVEHVKPAIAFVDYLQEVRADLFEGHGLSQVQQAQAAVERIVRIRRKILYSEALHLFHQGDAVLFRRIVESLSFTGRPIFLDNIGGDGRPKWMLYWVGDGGAEGVEH